MIVVDASVMAKIILKERDAGLALTFVDRHAGHLVGPDLLLTEVTSAIVRARNERKLTPLQSSELTAEWIGLWRVGFVASRRLTARLTSDAAGIAVELGHPLADCVYLALACRLSCDLVTAGVKFHAKANVSHPCVRLLSEFAH